MAPNYKFNLEALQMALDIRRKAFNLTWSQVAAEAKVSKSTISRIFNGKRPDVDTMVRLVMWCKIEFGHLVKTN